MFTRLRGISVWRKLSLVTWRTANDPTIYTWLEFNVEKAVAYLDEKNLEMAKLNPPGPKLTLTHFVAKAMSLVLAKYPALNGIIKWGTIYLRDSVDIFIQVAIPSQGNDNKDSLSGAKVTEVDKKSLAQIAQELVMQADKIRSGHDPQFKATFALANLLPIFVLRQIIRLHEFLVFNLGLNIPFLGLRSDPFGSAMVTSVGSLGVQPGLAPLVPPSRCPLIACVGVVEKKPWVENDQIVIKPVVTITFTSDHRFIDGLMGSRMIKMLKDVFANPHQYL